MPSYLTLNARLSIHWRAYVEGCVDTSGLSVARVSPTGPMPVLSVEPQPVMQAPRANAASEHEPRTLFVPRRVVAIVRAHSEFHARGRATPRHPRRHALRARIEPGASS